MHALRTAMGNTKWMEAAWPYFESRGSANKVYEVVQEMNGDYRVNCLGLTSTKPIYVCVHV